MIIREQDPSGRHAEPVRPLRMHLSSHSPHICDSAHARLAAAGLAACRRSDGGVSAYTNGLTDLVIDVNAFQRA